MISFLSPAAVLWPVLAVALFLVLSESSGKRSQTDNLLPIAHVSHAPTSTIRFMSPPILFFIVLTLISAFMFLVPTLFVMFVVALMFLLGDSNEKPMKEVFLFYSHLKTWSSRLVAKFLVIACLLLTLPLVSIYLMPGAVSVPVFLIMWLVLWDSEEEKKIKEHVYPDWHHKGSRPDWWSYTAGQHGIAKPAGKVDYGDEKPLENRKVRAALDEDEHQTYFVEWRSSAIKKCMATTTHGLGGVVDLFYRWLNRFFLEHTPPPKSFLRKPKYSDPRVRNWHPVDCRSEDSVYSEYSYWTMLDPEISELDHPTISKDSYWPDSYNKTNYNNRNYSNTLDIYDSIV